MSRRRFQLAGRHVLVTGGSSGIGLATALELARRGARVSILARREAELDVLTRRSSVLREGGGLQVPGGCDPGG